MKLNQNEKRAQKLRFSWINYALRNKNNITLTCRHFGISRPTYYKWFKRYQNLGKRGLIDLSKEPLFSPKTISPGVKKMIKNLRMEKKWGAVKISRWLNANKAISVSPSLIYKVFRSNKLNKLSLVAKLRRLS